MANSSSFAAAAVLSLLSLLLALSSASASAAAPPPTSPEPLVVLHGQAPFPLTAPLAVSPADRLFASAQTSNGVAVVSPFDSKLLGVTQLGGRLPEILGALYRGQSVVHGSGFSPDRKYVAAVCVGSDSVVFLDATGEKGYGVINTTSVGRSPHEASWTPSGEEVWVAVRGEDFVEILDGRPPFASLNQKFRVPPGPGMVAFSPDGSLAFVCSSFTPETVVIDAKTKETVASIEQNSTFCPNLAVTPDGTQLWLTLKDSGRTQVVEAREPFRTLAVIETGSVTNHVNFAVPPTTKAEGKNPKTLAFVTVGGERKVLVFSTEGLAFPDDDDNNNSTSSSKTPQLLKTIELPAGDDEPHAVWPSGDGTTVWVGLQIGNAAVAIDTRTLEVAPGSRFELGAQSPMGMVYLPGAAAGVAAKKSASSSSSFVSPERAREESRAFHFELVSPPSSSSNNNNQKVLTSLVVNRQTSAFVDALEAVVAGLRPGESYALCLTGEKEKNDKEKEKKESGGRRGGKDEKKKTSLSSEVCETVVVEFKGGQDKAANVATVGPFTDLLFEKENKKKNGKQQQLEQKRFFVVVPKVGEGFGAAVQVQQQ